MILADKIIRHRKKNGWSQEELAEKLNVSRQAVSKWESAQSIPELEKILALAYLFGVSTDYLIKDEIEDEAPGDSLPTEGIRKITIENANEYLGMRKKAAGQIALAVLLCILSPITLFILSAIAESGAFGIGENVAGIIGLSVMFLFVFCAVPIFIWCGFKNETYAFLDENEDFELGYGVKGMVEEHKKRFEGVYVKCNIIATCLCVFAPIPLIISGFLESDFISVIMLALMFLIAGAAVFLYLSVGIRQASMEKLLSEGNYTKTAKRRNGLKDTVGFVYWGVIVAIYLAWSFISDKWHVAAIVFGIGAIVFPAVMRICDYISDKTHK